MMLRVDPEPGTLLMLCLGGLEVVRWTNRDHHWALARGWYLDLEDGLITKDDDSAAFADADDVIDHLTIQAAAGDEVAIRAMIFTNHSNMMSWVARLEEH